MKYIIILSVNLLTILASSDALRFKRLTSPAIEHVHNQDDSGEYTLKYVTADGTIVTEIGRFVPTADGKDKVLVYEGQFQFISDDGKTYVTKYKTDAVGAHQPEGEHLPKPVEAEPVVEVKEDLVASA